MKGRYKNQPQVFILREILLRLIVISPGKIKKIVNLIFKTNLDIMAFMIGSNCHLNLSSQREKNKSNEKYIFKKIEGRNMGKELLGNECLMII